MANEKKMKTTLEVIIGFNADKEEIEYIKSDFLNEEFGFKDPIGYTAKLIQMGLETWIRDKIGIFCPNCEEELKENWIFCPNCGWSTENETTNEEG
jgi:hypothetical protein